MWELALGGAVALGFAGFPDVRVPDRLRGPLALLGLVGVLVAVLRFDGATPFPGTWALLPTLATALVIAAEPSPRSWAGRLLGTRPAQVLGDVSYSTYLWHWPLIVLVPFAIGRRLAWYDLVAVAAASVALAVATKRWVEDPVRRSPPLIRSPRATTAVLVVCTATGVLAGLALLGWAGVQEARASEDAELAAELAAEHPECFGAAPVLTSRGLQRTRRPAPDPAADRRGRQVPPLRRPLLERAAVRVPGELHLRPGRRRHPRRPGRQLARRELVPAAGRGRRRARLAGHHRSSRRSATRSTPRCPSTTPRPPRGAGTGTRGSATRSPRAATTSS